MGFWSVFWERLPYFLPILLGAAVMTVQVTLGALALALVLGMVVALLRISPLKPVRALALAYIEIMRGTPALVQLFIIYFGLPDLGIELKPVPAAIIGLGMNGAAYVAEIYRAGIQAIHRGQMEASLSLGMTPASAMRYIVLPQAVGVVLPPLGAYALNLIKETTLASVVAAPEIMFEARKLVTETYLSTQIYLIVGAIYLCLSLPLARVVARLERARSAWR